MLTYSKKLIIKRREKMNLMEETLPFLKKNGTKAAIINQNNQSLSFAQFYDYTTKLSFLFKSQGLTKGQKVVIIAPLDWPLYCAIAASFQTGATVVLVDPWASDSYIQDALSQVEPEFLILSKKARFFYLKTSIRKIPRHLLLEDLIEHKTLQREEEVTEVDENHSALITFTSGTTGKPKGFDRSHLFLLSQQRAHEIYFEHGPTDINLTMYPVFVLSYLKSGMSSVLVRGDLRKIHKLDPEKLYQQINLNNVTSMSVSPVILEKLIGYCEEKKLPLHLKKIFTGGAPVKREITERILKLNPEINGTIIYGSTEAEPIALVKMSEVVSKNPELKFGTPLGRVVDALKHQILPLAEKIHPYHQGTIGEMTITGDFVGKKYLNNEEAFKENKFIGDDGEVWHKTGDIVNLKNDSLYMMGRKNHPIRTSQGLLFPIPIENQIDSIAGVKRSAYVEVHEKIFLIFEKDKNDSDSIHNIITLFFKQENLPCDEVKQIEEIPMDERHRSKINIPKLKTIISKGKHMSLTKDSPLSKRLLAYTKERFPLLPILLFVFLLTLGYGRHLTLLSGMEFSWGLNFWITMMTVFIFMLQLRMADEIKDFQKDSLAYPERILSRGIIPLKTVSFILYLSITIELLLSYFMGIQHFVLMVILQFWAFLMAREFFCKKFLDTQVTISLFLHQIILAPLAIYSALPFVDVDKILSTQGLFISLAYLVLIYTVYEMARKTWPEERENQHADSYTRFWGINTALVVQFFLTLTIFTLQEFTSLTNTKSFSFRSISFCVGAFYIGTLGLFKLKPDRKRSKLVELGGSLFLLGMCALNGFN